MAAKNHVPWILAILCLIFPAPAHSLFREGREDLWTYVRRSGYVPERSTRMAGHVPRWMVVGRGMFQRRSPWGGLCLFLTLTQMPDLGLTSRVGVQLNTIEHDF